MGSRTDQPHLGSDLGYSRVFTTSERLDHQLDAWGVGVSPRRPAWAIPSVIMLLIERFKTWPPVGPERTGTSARLSRGLGACFQCCYWDACSLKSLSMASAPVVSTGRSSRL
jgi:hypothetical protein